MLQKIVDLVERFVAAYEKDVEHRRHGQVVARIGGPAEAVDSPEPVASPALASGALAPILAPEDREVLKTDLKNAGVAYGDRAQTPTLQKLWLEMKAKAAAPAKTYTAEEVRAKSITCAGLSSKEDVQEIFQRVGGAKKFTEIPEDKYAAIMDALEGIK